MVFFKLFQEQFFIDFWNRPPIIKVLRLTFIKQRNNLCCFDQGWKAIFFKTFVCTNGKIFHNVRSNYSILSRRFEMLSGRTFRFLAWKWHNNFVNLIVSYFSKLKFYWYRDFNCYELTLLQWLQKTPKLKAPLRQNFTGYVRNYSE